MFEGIIDIEVDCIHCGDMVTVDCGNTDINQNRLSRSNRRRREVRDVDFLLR